MNVVTKLSPEVDPARPEQPGLVAAVEPWIDRDWYLGQCSAIARAELAGAPPATLAEHFLRSGAAAGLSPTPTFSTIYYQARCGELPKGVNPLVHYLEEGAAKLLSPHPLLRGGASLAIDGEIDSRGSALWDPGGYLELHPDVAAAGVEPLFHYFSMGIKAGRCPHRLFDQVHYRAQLGPEENVPDLFAHYLAVGWKKGLTPHPTYDPLAYAPAPAGIQDISPFEKFVLSPEPVPEPALTVELPAAPASKPVTSALVSTGGTEGEALSKPIVPKSMDWSSAEARARLLRRLISPTWYLHQLDPIARRTLQASEPFLENVAEHYLEKGSQAGLSPLYSFSTAYYRSRYSADLHEGEEPLFHYLRVGRSKGYAPHPLLKGGASLEIGETLGRFASSLFDAKSYLRRYPDVARSKLDPLLHYFRWGLVEGRSPHALFDIEHYFTQLDTSARPADPLVHHLTEGLGLSPHPMFDLEFYLEQNPELRATGQAPLEHYALVGAAQRQSVHPLFDVTHYLTQIDAADRSEDLAAHFVSTGSRLHLNPHPLFDSAYAAQKGGFGGRAGAFLSFIAAPFSGTAIHPLFDIEYYLGQRRAPARTVANPLLDYLRFGSAEGLSPHPLFDPQYYATQVGEGAEQTADLVHYVTTGWASDLSPHPLFDPRSFQSGLPRNRPRTCPLVEYVLRPAGTKPHYLFDEDFFRRRATEELPAGKPGLELYLTDPALSQNSTHPLFEPAHYIAGAAKYLARVSWQVKGGALDRLKRDLDPQRVQSLPLLHYVQAGFRYGLSPSPTFDAAHYQRATGLPPGADLLRHYLLEGGMAHASPHPAMDLQHYARHAIGYDPAKVPMFLHLLSRPHGERARTSPLLDPDWYGTENSDIARFKLCPIEHFIRHGMQEGRLPNPFFSAACVNSVHRNGVLHEQTPLWEYFSRDNGRNKLRVLFIGHEASRTGAPLILLRLIEGLTAAHDIDPYTILGAGGDLVPEFQAASHCRILAAGLDRPFLDAGPHSEGWLTELRSLLGVFGPSGPDLVVCNTAETRAFADYFARANVPVVSLVHETADFYDSAQFGLIYDSSKVTIFPSEYTRAQADAKAPLAGRSVVVRGQGLLDPAFGHLGRGAARTMVLEELGLPDDARLVIGCGTADLRKGIDLFVDTAMRTLADPRAKDVPLYFVWVGAGKTFTGPDAWARRRIEAARLGSRVIFAGPRPDTEPFYRASDVMLMSSRMDPFPCVVHEAMACELPIIAFEGCSGAPEAFGASGVVVPAEDTVAMADALLDLVSDEPRRAALGARARAMVAERWQFSDYVRDIAALIEQHAGFALPVREEAASGDALAAPPTMRPKSARTIYFSSPDWGISGVNTFTHNLIEGLNERGFDARLLFTNGRLGTLPVAEMMPTLPATYLPLSTHHFVSVWQTLNAFLTKHRPCIYVPNYDYVGSAISPIIHPSVGVVGIAHSDDVEHYEHVDRLGRYWDRIVAVSKHIQSEIVELNPAFAAKTSTIYYGVPFDEAAARKRVATRARSAKSPIVLTYSGRIVTQQKNIMAFATLAESLQDAGVPFKLNLLGDGEDYNNLRWKLSTLIESGVVKMPGRVTPAEIARYLDHSDAFVLLSDFEGLPLSMLEGMAKGVVPVVRDMKSGIPEVITSGVNGFITARHDIDAMVAVLKDLQADPERLRILGNAAIDSFKAKRLAQDAMVDTYATLFEGLFEELPTREKPRPMPLAYNAPIKGVAAPPFLQRRQ